MPAKILIKAVYSICAVGCLSFWRETKVTRRYCMVKSKLLTKKTKKGVNYGKILYIAFVVLTVSVILTQTVFAADTIWDKASEIMKDVYSKILTISTIAAIVTASVALLLMNFSKSGKTVDESRAWLKRIIITWAILNGLGFIMAWVTPFFTGGQWTG